MPDKELKRLKDFVVERRRYCLDYRIQNFDDKWERALSDYDPSPKTRKSGSSLNLPELFIRTEVLLAHCIADFFGYAETVLAAYAEREEYYERSPKVTMLWEHRARQMQFALKMIPYFRQCILLGTTAAALNWRTKYGFRRVRKPKFNEYGDESRALGTHVEHFYEELLSQPELTPLDMFSTWMDPDAPSCLEEDLRDIGVERWVSRAKLQELVESGYVDEGVLDLDFKKFSGRHEDAGNALGSADKRKDILGLRPNPLESNYNTEQAPVSEWWGDYFPKGAKVAVPMCVWIVDPDGVAILARPFKKLDEYGNHPYDHCKKPIIVSNYVMRDFFPYGWGLGEILSGTNSELQERVNIRLKNISLAVQGMMCVVEQSVINAEDLSARAQGMIRFRSTIEGNLKHLTFDDHTQNISAQIVELRQFMDQLSGLDSLMMASPPPSGAKTPISSTEANIRQRMGSKRFSFTVGVMMATGPAKIADMTHELNKQHMQEDYEFKTLKQEAPNKPVEPNYQTISPSDLEGNWEFVYVADPLRANELLERQQKVSALGLLIHPLLTQPYRAGGITQLWQWAKNLCEVNKLPWQELLMDEEKFSLVEKVQMTIQANVDAQMLMQTQGFPGGGAPGMTPSEAIPGQESGDGMSTPELRESSQGGAPPLPQPPMPQNPAGRAPMNEEAGTLV